MTEQNENQGKMFRISQKELEIIIPLLNPTESVSEFVHSAIAFYLKQRGATNG